MNSETIFYAASRAKCRISKIAERAWLLLFVALMTSCNIVDEVANYSVNLGDLFENALSPILGNLICAQTIRGG